MLDSKIARTYFVPMVALLLSANAHAQYSWANLPVIVQPVFKKDTFNIKSFGAVEGGITLNTASINKAIETCNKQGGGVVMVPPGLWLTGPVEMRSNVNLYLQQAAMLLFTTDKSQYDLVEAVTRESPLPATSRPYGAITWRMWP